MRTLSEWESKQLLGPGLPLPRERRTATVDEGVAFARSLAPAPMVAKASGVAHKTEGRLVRLGVDVDGVAAAWAELAAAGDGTVLVAEQVPAELELLVGGLRDPVFGPVVSVGIGGTAAEILGDAAFLLAPPEAGELDRAVAQLRGAALLDGVRGAPAVDRVGLAAIVAAVGGLLVREEDVVEVDCNPVLVHDGVPVVADALVVVAGD